MRKLKSIKQILEENPDAYFNVRGQIILPTKWVIRPDEFVLFGKIYRGGSGECMDDSWFESEPEPKKLYAYRKMSGLVMYVDEDDRYMPSAVRMPEFDLTFGGKQ